MTTAFPIIGHPEIMKIKLQTKLLEGVRFRSRSRPHVSIQSL